MCLTGGEGDENMGGGGITPISVTPRLSCISPAGEISFNKRKQDVYLHIFFKNTHSLKQTALTIVLGVTTGGNPLVGVNRERVHGLSHWKK